MSSQNIKNLRTHVFQLIIYSINLHCISQNTDIYSRKTKHQSIKRFNAHALKILIVIKNECLSIR